MRGEEVGKGEGMGRRREVGIEKQSSCLTILCCYCHVNSCRSIPHPCGGIQLKQVSCVLIEIGHYKAGR